VRELHAARGGLVDDLLRGAVVVRAPVVVVGVLIFTTPFFILFCFFVLFPERLFICLLFVCV
jgi:hypothetical protein